MDPFNRLPWFALRYLLSHLPDLPTLHTLSIASPTIATFLQEDNSFSEIVENIISNPTRDKGLYQPVRTIIRTLTLIWWRKHTYHSSEDDDHHHDHQNPLTRSYTELIRSLIHNPDYKPKYPFGGMRPLPRYIPFVILYRLLEFSTKIRRITHAFFHAMIKNCMDLTTLEHLPRGKRYHSYEIGLDRSKRPAGKPFKPYDLGAPTWFEEQRLLYAVLRVVLFFELRDAIGSVPGFFSEMGVGACWVSPGANNILKFWKSEVINDMILVEQLRTFISWLAAEAGGRDKIESWMLSSSSSSSSVSLPDNLSYCCPKFRPVKEQRWTSFGKNAIWLLYPRGYDCISDCGRSPNSPLRGVDSSYYRRFGVVFWDSARLNALGLVGRRRNVEAMWFAWSSVLNESDWERLGRYR